MSRTVWRSPKTKRNCLSKMFQYKEIIIFDTETTGLKAADNFVIELAAQKYKICAGTKLEKIDEINIYLKPPFAVSDFIEKLTGITNEFLSDKPSCEDAFDKIDAFFGNEPFICGYNIGFDIGFMEATYERCGKSFNYIASLDVLEMARDLVPSYDVKDYKLGTIASALSVDEGITFHSAIDDVEVTKRVFEVFYNMYMDNGEEDSDRICPTVNSVRYKKGHNHFENRIYVNTSEGTCFYRIYSKEWMEWDEGVFDRVNMEYVEKTVWEMAGVSSKEEFAKFKGAVNKKATA